MRVELNGLLEIGKYQIHQRDGLFVLSHNSKEFGSLKRLVEDISIVTKFSKNEVDAKEITHDEDIYEDEDLETDTTDFDGDDDFDDEEDEEHEGAPPDDEDNGIVIDDDKMKDIGGMLDNGHE